MFDPYVSLPNWEFGYNTMTQKELFLNLILPVHLSLTSRLADWAKDQKENKDLFVSQLGKAD